MKRITITSGYAQEESFGYSRAVRIGDSVYVSGTTARPPALYGDAGTQARAAIEGIREALAEVGAELRHVVRTVVYVRDAADLPSIAVVHREAFGAAPPANTFIQVAALLPAEALVEVQVDAIVHD